MNCDGEKVSLQKQIKISSYKVLTLDAPIWTWRCGYDLKWTWDISIIENIAYKYSFNMLLWIYNWNIYVRINIGVCMYMHIYVWACICAYACMYMCMYACMHILLYIFVYMCIHACVYTRGLIIYWVNF